MEMHSLSCARQVLVLVVVLNCLLLGLGLGLVTLIQQWLTLTKQPENIKIINKKKHNLVKTGCCCAVFFVDNYGGELDVYKATAVVKPVRVSSVH